MHVLTFPHKAISAGTDTGTPSDLWAKHHTDAHFVAYMLFCDGMPVPTPRLNLNTKLDTLPRFGVFALDIDNPDHGKHVDKESAELGIVKAIESAPIQPSAAYTTRGGYRLIWELEEWEQIDVRVYDAKLTALAESFPQDVDVDFSCLQWNRLYRCPDVVRDGVSQSEEPWYIKIETGETYSIDAFPSKENFTRKSKSQSATRKSSYIPELNTPMPDVIKSRLLIESAGEYTPIGAEFAKKLKGETFQAAFNPSFTLRKGERSSGLLRIAGIVSVAATGIYASDQRHAFGLLAPLAESLGEDEGTGKPFTVILWEAILRYFELNQERAIKSKVQASAGECSISRVFAKVKEWDITTDEHDLDACKMRLFVNCGQNFYPLLETGRYSGKPLQRNQLAAFIKESWLRDVLGTISAKTGKYRVPNAEEIATYHSTIVYTVEYMPGNHTGIIKGEKFIAPMYSRVNLEPEYNKEIDTWLKKLFGANFNIAVQWLAYALDIESGPICALSLVTPPGVGKNLLVQGVAECFTNGSICGASELISDKQGTLLRTPLVHINERWPSFKSAQKDPSGMLREVIGGGPISVREMYRSPVTATVPARVMMTANNDYLLNVLAHDQLLTPDDREAIAERILHIHLNRDAKYYLEENGGMAFTGEWVANATGRNKHRLAKHLLWLYEQRHSLGVVGPRFLVDGRLCPNNRVTTALLADQNYTPLVLETLLLIIDDAIASGGYNKPVSNENVSLYDGDKGEFAVTVSQVITKYRKNLSDKVNTRTMLSHHKVREVLINFSRHIGELGVGVFTLDCIELNNVAESMGMIHEGLAELANMQN